MANPDPDAAAPQPAATKTTPRLVQAVVAPRRSLIVQEPSGVSRRVLPGAVVNLPLEEVTRLRAGGFLVPAGGAAVVQTRTPSLPQPTINGRLGSQVGPGGENGPNPSDGNPASTPAA